MLPPALEVSSWSICVDSIIIKLSSASCWHWTWPTTAHAASSKACRNQGTHSGQTSVKWHHFRDLSYSHSLASPTAVNNIPSPLWIRYMLTRWHYKSATPTIHNLTTKTILYPESSRNLQEQQKQNINDSKLPPELRCLYDASMKQICLLAIHVRVLSKISSDWKLWCKTKNPHH